MPRALMPCRQPACGALLVGGGYCPEHKRLAFASQNPVAPLPPDWPVIHARILTRDGHRCVLCGAPATTVDHIIARAFGGTHEDANLRSLCPPHAARKDWIAIGADNTTFTATGFVSAGTSTLSAGMAGDVAAFPAAANPTISYQNYRMHDMIGVP